MGLNVSCGLKTFTTTDLTKKKEKEEEAEISQEVTSKEVVEEEVTVEVIPQQGVQDEGIAFILFLYVNEMVK